MLGHQHRVVAGFVWVSSAVLLLSCLFALPKGVVGVPAPPPTAALTTTATTTGSRPMALPLPGFDIKALVREADFDFDLYRLHFRETIQSHVNEWLPLVLATTVNTSTNMSLPSDRSNPLTATNYDSVNLDGVYVEGYLDPNEIKDESKILGNLRVTLVQALFTGTARFRWDDGVAMPSLNIMTPILNAALTNVFVGAAFEELKHDLRIHPILSDIVAVRITVAGEIVMEDEINPPVSSNNNRAKMIIVITSSTVAAVLVLIIAYAIWWVRRRRQMKLPRPKRWRSKHWRSTTRTVGDDTNGDNEVEMGSTTNMNEQVGAPNSPGADADSDDGIMGMTTMPTLLPLSPLSPPRRGGPANRRKRPVSRLMNRSKLLKQQQQGRSPTATPLYCISEGDNEDETTTRGHDDSLVVVEYKDRPSSLSGGGESPMGVHTTTRYRDNPESPFSLEGIPHLNLSSIDLESSMDSSTGGESSYGSNNSSRGGDGGGGGGARSIEFTKLDLDSTAETTASSSSSHSFDGGSASSPDQQRKSRDEPVHQFVDVDFTRPEDYELRVMSGGLYFV